jgi:hypothetical protein
VILADNQAPVEVVVVLSIIVPLAVLGVVCWIFWRSRHRP